jgi:hypothetical protein
VTLTLVHSKLLNSYPVQCKLFLLSDANLRIHLSTPSPKAERISSCKLLFSLSIVYCATKQRWRLRQFPYQGCQIFLDTMYKIYQIYTKLRNSPKIYQMAVIYSKWPWNCTNIFHSKALQNLPKLGYLVLN